MKDIEGRKDWDNVEESKDDLDNLKSYIDANRHSVEIEAVRYGILNVIEDVKACRDQNIRALLYDLEKCNKLCIEFLTFWKVKAVKIEQYIERLTQEVSDEPSKTDEFNSKNTKETQQ